MARDKDLREMLGGDALAPEGDPLMVPQWRGVLQRISDDHERLRSLVRLLEQAPAARRNPPDELISDLAWHLHGYAEAKERGLYEPLGKYAAQVGHIVAKGRQHQAAVAAAVDALRQEPADSKPWRATLDELARRLEALIAHEERELLPAATSVLSEPELDRLSDVYERARAES